MKSYRPILIVGPSGIGKSTACRIAAVSLPDVVFGNLDDLAGQWAFQMQITQRPDIHALNAHYPDREQFFNAGLEAIKSFVKKHSGHQAVIDVGAAFQDAQTAAHLADAFAVVAITATPQVAYHRHVAARGPRAFDHFCRHDFSPQRVAVMESAQYKIDTTEQSPDETAAELVAVIRTI